MNKFLSGITVSFLAVVGLVSPALAQQIPTGEQPSPTGTSGQTTANDYVCKFRYEMGNETREGSTSGTTRLAAREARNQQIERLENQAEQRGENIEVTYQACRDPFGPN